jgi:hypothetical protein
MSYGDLDGTGTAFLYDQPITMGRFLVELSAAVILVALVSGLAVAKALVARQLWFRQ